MCGWFHTRGTWGVGLFPGVVGGFFYAIARAACKILYPKTIIISLKSKKGREDRRLWQRVEVLCYHISYSKN